jgi:hypothetical protein
MKLTLSIDKSSAEDCHSDCPCMGRDEDSDCWCGAFRCSLLYKGSDRYFACDECQELYRQQEKEK